MDRSTIAAIATPEGFGGIGIIKISGPSALSVIHSIFKAPTDTERDSRPAVKDHGASLQSWHLHHGVIYDPERGRTIDEVLVAVMRGPRSYTREDVVEIQAHAGPKVLHTILDLLLARGIRLAEPGEFTKRAYLNGRIDLTQAEAVIDLINAKSDAAIDMVMSQMSGGFKSVIDNIKASILSVLAQIEVGIDFPEAVEDEIDTKELERRLIEDVQKPVSELIDAYDQGHIVREGLRVVIVGGPNVGKSSLLNCLVQQQRALVTDIPGTTRDFIESSLLTRGIPIVLADTAGLRIAPDPVEKLGIEKTREYIETADIILFTIDVGEAVRSEHFALFEELAGKRLILVMNKIDLPESSKRFKRPTRWQSVPHVEVSALYGEGVSQLKDMIADMATQATGCRDSRHVPNVRQKEALARALSITEDAMKRLREDASPELIAVDLREAQSALSEITGEHVRDDVLDEIFNRYCIGK